MGLNFKLLYLLKVIFFQTLGEEVVNEILPQHKYDAKTGENDLFAGLNSKGFFAIDHRLPGSKVVDAKKYIFFVGGVFEFLVDIHTQQSKT